jgi:hypothetical protein
LSYRAIDISLQGPVALKLIAPELAEGERFRARFLMKPRLAASLDHPSVVPIFEAGELHMHAPRRRREKHEAPRLCNARKPGARSHDSRGRLHGSPCHRRHVCEPSEQLCPGGARWRRPARRKLSQDRLDPVMQRVVIIEYGGPVE